MRKFFILLTALFSVGFGCRKQLPILPEGDSPVFYFKITSPELNLQLEAGINGVSYSDNTIISQLVKYYSGTLQKADTSFVMNFFAGEVYRNMKFEDFMALSSIDAISLSSPNLTTTNIDDLTQSSFDFANFIIDETNYPTSYNFTSPGIYAIGINASKNGQNANIQNLLVVGYDNPYKFELLGNINSSGPGIIIEGSVENLSSGQNIEKIEWTCGGNQQTTTINQVQFPPSNSSNLLVAKVFFTDGTIRQRTITLGLQNGLKIQDVVYLIESNSSVSFSQKFEAILSINNETYETRFVTEFPQGAPSLSITNKSIYTDPVTKEKANLIKANGLIYLKNSTTNVTYTVQLEMQIGLPLNF